MTISDERVREWAHKVHDELIDRHDRRGIEEIIKPAVRALLAEAIEQERERQSMNAARYEFIRELLAIEDVERLVAEGNPAPQEEESLKTDAAIDAAIRPQPQTKEDERGFGMRWRMRGDIGHGISTLSSTGSEK